jgi:hypothetical protein
MVLVGAGLKLTIEYLIIFFGQCLLESVIIDVNKMFKIVSIGSFQSTKDLFKKLFGRVSKKSQFLLFTCPTRQGVNVKKKTKKRQNFSNRYIVVIYLRTF